MMFWPIQHKGKSSGCTESLVGDFLLSIADIDHEGNYLLLPTLFLLFEHNLRM